MLYYFRQGQLPQEVMDHPEHKREQQHRENRVLVHHQQYSIHLPPPCFVASPVVCSELPKAIPLLFGLSCFPLYSLLAVMHCLAFLSSLRQWESLNSVHYSPPLCWEDFCCCSACRLSGVREVMEKEGEWRRERRRQEKRKGRGVGSKWPGTKELHSYVALVHEIITGMSEPEAITFFRSTETARQNGWLFPSNNVLFMCLLWTNCRHCHEIHSSLFICCCPWWIPMKYCRNELKPALCTFCHLNITLTY